MESSRLARVDRTVERLGTDEGAAAAAAAGLVLLAAAAAAYKGRRRRRRRAGDGCIFGEGWGLDGSLVQGERKRGAKSSRNMCPLKNFNHGAKALCAYILMHWGGKSRFNMRCKRFGG